MKTFLKVVLICLLLSACSGGNSGNDDTTPPIEKNNTPAIPTLVYPTNNLLCINNTLEFDWSTSTDSDGDAVTYNIEVSNNNQFSTIAFSTNSSVTKHIFTLEKGFAYYWRVKATDSKNVSSSYSSTFNLYTEGLGVSNHLPFAPQLIKPELSATIESGITTLEWSGSDTDGDVLTYDVYFDENNPPSTLFSENQSEPTYNVDISTASNYYWKIVVNDGNGGETIGQVWGFNTD
jgi:hypothetical protein